MSARTPQRPADLHGVPLRELLAAWYSHVEMLVDAQHGHGGGRSAAQLRAAALGLLVTAAALAEQVGAGRWATAAQALGYGVAVAEVAAAMGITVEETSVGLRRWLDAQARQRLITPVQREETLALLVAGGVR